MSFPGFPFGDFLGRFAGFNNQNAADQFERIQMEMFAQQEQRQTSNPSTPNLPPASKRVVSKLPQIVVTKEDLDEDSTNVECAICLADQKIGQIATKLPCGHIYCPECLKPWLLKSCSCPVCRFELETDDPEYEPIRKEKMRNHKLRFRISELRVMSVGDLRRLLTTLGISSAGCLEKSELIDRLESSGRVVIVKSASNAQIYGFHELMGMTPVQLRNLMTSLGVHCESAIEKTDIIEAMAASGRISINREDPPLPPDNFETMKVAKLKALIASRGLSPANCVEKSDLIRLLRENS